MLTCVNVTNLCGANVECCKLYLAFMYTGQQTLLIERVA